MVFFKTLVLTAVLAVVNSRTIPDGYEYQSINPYDLVQDQDGGVFGDFEPVYPEYHLRAKRQVHEAVNSRTIPDGYDYQSINPYHLVQDQDGGVFGDFEPVYPEYHLRAKRQVHGAVSTNPDGSTNIVGKLPLYNNGNNALSAIGSVEGAKPGGSFGAAGGGLALDNVNGHGLSLTGKHIPGFGNQLTGAGKVNLIDTDRHNLNANAFITRSMPTIPNAPNFNTHGASLDYMYNNKVGATLAAAHTPLFQKTDVSAMGNLNLFRDRTSSLDFNAGATRSFSPFIPKSSWQPSFNFGYTRYF